MTEVLGAIDIAINWTQKAVQIVQEIAAAREDVDVLIQDLRVSLFILDETKSLFKSVDEQKDKAEDQKKWLDQLIQKTCKEFHEVLERLETAFRVKTTSHGKLYSLWERTEKGAKWSMKKSAIQDWIAKIQKQNGAIKSMVQILDAMNGRDMMMNQKYIQDAMSHERFLKVVEKLPAQDKSPVEILERISQSLPEWILEQADYRQWSGIDEPLTDNTCNWLWLFGAAGSGKSHIATYVFHQLWRSSLDEKQPQLSTHQVHTAGLQEAVDGHESKPDEKLDLDDDGDDDDNHSEEAHAHDNVRPTGSASAIYYCQDATSDSQTEDSIFRTLVRQLVQQLWQAAPQSAYTHLDSLSALSGGVSDAASHDDAKPAYTVLADVANCLARAHIVIDALDELSTPAVRHLMPRLRSLRQQCPRLKIFTTSRDGMRADAESYGAIKLASGRENASTLATFVRVQLASLREKGHQAEAADWAGSAHDEDDHEAQPSKLQRYDGEPALPKLLESESSLQAVGDRIVEVADGNFLAAELLLQRLMNEMQEASLQDALESLSGALGDLIAEAVERIDTQRSRELAAIGRHTLLWVSHAPNGAMMADELRHALALSLYGNADKWHSLHIKDVLKATGYFVALQGQGASITAHKAVRDFCLDPYKGAAYFPNAHGIMAKACLACLDACIVPCRDANEWDKATQANPFLGYAAANWGWHLALAEEAMPAAPLRRLELMRVLAKDKALDAVTMAVQPRLRKLGIWQDARMGPMLRRRSLPRPISVVHMLALFDLPQTAREWLVHSGQDADGLQHLVDYYRSQAGPDRGPGDCCSALFLASMLGHDAVVQVLLEAGANPLRVNGAHRTTALAAAINNNFSRTVVTLLARDSAQAMVQQRMETVPRILPLALACGSTSRRGRARIIIEILAAMEEMDNYSAMLLDRAGPKGLTALHRAVESNEPDVIAALLDAPAGNALLELASSRHSHETPLCTAAWAAWNGGTAAVSCLVSRGANVAARNKDGDTPLHALARHEGHVRLDKTDCFEWLLRHLLNQNQNQNQNAPLPGLDLTLQNLQGQTVLHTACHDGRYAHVAVLLAPDYLEKTRATFHTRSNNGHGARTPIMAAAYARGGAMSSPYARCVRLLIPHVARDMSLDDAVALYRELLRQDKPKAVELLLDHRPGFEDHVTSHGTRTFLHQAIEAGHLRMVQLAIRRGGGRDLEKPNAAGETPFREAQRRRKADVASYLLEQGATVGSNVSGAALRLCVDLSDEALTRALWRREPKSLEPREQTSDRSDALRHMSVRNAVYRLWRDHGLVPAPQMPVRQVLCLQARRDDLVEVSGPMNGEAGVYLETEPLGDQVKIPLSRLDITITAQDQGWSNWQDQNPHHKGTFHGSDTWFEVALKRDGTLVRQLECTRNLLNVGDWTTYHIAWDGESRLGELQEASGTQTRSPDGLQAGYARPGRLRTGDVEGFVTMIRGGDRILILPRSRGDGWVCRVKSVQVKAWYEEDGGLC